MNNPRLEQAAVQLETVGAPFGEYSARMAQYDFAVAQLLRAADAAMGEATLPIIKAVATITDVILGDHA